MDEETDGLRHRAIRACEVSELRAHDERERRLEKAALRRLLRELGLNADPAGSVIELDGVTLTAHYEPAPGIPIDGEDPVNDVRIQAHERCRLCGDMRHSHPFISLWSMAAQLGQWLTEHHDCPPSDDRRMGFRASGG